VQQRPQPPHRWGFGPAAIIALAGVVALIDQWSWARPLWLDEEMIALNLRDRTVAGLAGPLWLNQSAPLGWLALQRALIVQFGPTERTLRAAPVLFGMATLALAWWAGRRWMRPFGAAVFVLLCSFGQQISFFPLESKPYSADVFWALLLSVLAVWAMEPATDDPAPPTSDPAPHTRDPARDIRRVARWCCAPLPGAAPAGGTPCLLRCRV
jgi:hypothetical protein